MDIAECSVCYEKYGKSQTRPRVLPCGHTFCSRCLGRILQLPDLFRNCPTCTRSFISTSLESYPPNYALEAVLDLSPRCAPTEDIHGKAGPEAGARRVFQQQLSHENSQLEAYIPATLHALPPDFINLALYVSNLIESLSEWTAASLAKCILSSLILVEWIAVLLARCILSCLQPNITTSNVIVWSVFTGCTTAVVAILSQPGGYTALTAAVQAVQPSSFWLNISRPAWPRLQLYHMLQMFTTSAPVCLVWGFIYESLKLFGLIMVCPLLCILALPYWMLVSKFCPGDNNPHMAEYYRKTQDAGMEWPLWWPIDTDPARTQQCYAALRDSY